MGSDYVGCICKEFAIFRPKYSIECNGWRVDGDFLEWIYSIVDENGYGVAIISRQLFHWNDTYVIDVVRSQDALCALMVVLAIDAEKCSGS